jgi:ankyrin repeat protein
MSVSQTNSNPDIGLFVEAKPRIDETTIQAWERMINEGTITNINVQYRSMTALMFQSANGTTENMTWLLQKGADPNIQDSDGKTALRWALTSDSHIDDKINLLLQNGADPNIKDNKGVTPLDTARTEPLLNSAVAILEKATNSNVSVAPSPPVINQSSNVSSVAGGVKNQNQENIDKFVRANGTNAFVINLLTQMKQNGTMPDINVRDSQEGLTAIMFQTIHGTIDTMKWLLEQPGIDVNLKSKNGNTALMMATKNNKPDKVKLLLENGADQNISNIYGDTPLSIARSNNRTDKYNEIKTLLTPPVKSNPILDPTSLSSSPILDPTSLSSSSPILDPTSLSSSSNPFDSSSSSSSSPIIDPSGSTRGSSSPGTVIGIEKQYNSFGLNLAQDPVSRKLVVIGFSDPNHNNGVIQVGDVITGIDNTEITRMEYDPTIKNILSRIPDGVVVNFSIDRSNTDMALVNKLKSEQNRQAKIISDFVTKTGSGKGKNADLEKREYWENALRNGGYNIDNQDIYGMTALAYQTRNGSLNDMKFLLSRGANPNLVAENGMTALHYAAFNNDLDKVKLLLENGADRYITNIDGETPLELATKNGKTRVIDTLTNYIPVIKPKASSRSGAGAEEEQTPIVKNFLKLSPIKMVQKDKTGKVVLSNRLIYIGPIEVKEPKLFNVTGADGKITPYLINIIEISDTEGRLEQRQSSLSPNDIDWRKIALPSDFDANPTRDDLPNDANQWVSYNMDYIFAALANNTNTGAMLSKNFSNEMTDGFFQPDYTEDIMFNKPNLQRLQRQTFKQLVIFFNALMETLDQIYTHSISSVLNPEKKQCLTDSLEPEEPSNGLDPSITSSSGPSTSSSIGPSIGPSNDQQLLDKIEKFYNAGKMKEILTLESEVNGATEVPLRTEMELYILLAKFETPDEPIDLNTILDLLNTYIDIIVHFPTDIKTKCTRLVFKILFYTYQDQRIKEWYTILSTKGSIKLPDLKSNLNTINVANFTKQIMKNDPGNPAFATGNPEDDLMAQYDDLMAKYKNELTAVDKTDYEKEIADTMAAAKNAKSDLKWTLAELLYKRAHQFAVVYFGYGSPEEGVAMAEMNTFVDLNRKNGSGLIKFVGDLLSQLTSDGSVYKEFISTDNSKPPIIPDSQNIASLYRRQIDAVISSEITTRITKEKLFEEVPSNETEKQMPGAIIGALIGILSNMIIQMTLYIYIVNQLRVKDIDNVNIDNNELILLFNILAGLKIAERRIIKLSSEQNKNLGEDDDDFEETKVDSAFLNKLMASVLASGSMLGVLAVVGGRKSSRKKRRAKGLKSRRLNSKNNSSRKGRTRRYVKKGKTTRKLRQRNRRL